MHLSFTTYLKGSESIRNMAPDAKNNKTAYFKV